MLSISVLFLILIFCLFLAKKYHKNFIKFIIVVVFSFFIIECLVYAYFIYLIYQPKCFYLIGNQKILDQIIKARLIYSAYYAQGKKNNIYIVDNYLGYSLGKDKDAGLYKTNSQGLRSDKEYQLIPPENILRIAAFGDSFVFCDGEKNSTTWTNYLENSVGNLDVLNFGVSGYGLGQSYLRYLKDGLKFKPDIVFFNYMDFGWRDKISTQEILSGIDLRHAEVYRVIFEVEDNILITKSITPFDLFNKSFRELYIYGPAGFHEEKGFWSNKVFSIFNTGLLIKSIVLKKILPNRVRVSEKNDEEMNLKILENLLSTAKENGAIILFFYNDFDHLPENKKNLLRQYEENVVCVSSESIDYTFSRYGYKPEYLELRNHTYHYNARGNQLYAETILGILKGRKWGKGSRIFEYSEKGNCFRKIKNIN